MKVRHAREHSTSGTAKADEAADKRERGSERGGGGSGETRDAAAERGVLGQMKAWLKNKVDTALDVGVGTGHTATPRHMPSPPDPTDADGGLCTEHDSGPHAQQRRASAGNASDGSDGASVRQAWREAGGRVMEDGAPGEAAACECVQVPAASLLVIVGSHYQVRCWKLQLVCLRALAHARSPFVPHITCKPAHYLSLLASMIVRLTPCNQWQVSQAKTESCSPTACGSKNGFPGINSSTQAPRLIHGCTQLRPGLGLPADLRLRCRPCQR